MHVAIHSFSHDGEEYHRGKTYVRSDHPVIAKFPGNFAPAPDRIAARSSRASQRRSSTRDLETELSYRREVIAGAKIRRREEERERERELRRQARQDEDRFWAETAELLSGDDVDMRSALDELDQQERQEALEQDWAEYRRAQMDPSSQSWWDEGVALGERLQLDPDGTVAEAVREENERIKLRKRIANGEAELWENGE